MTQATKRQQRIIEAALPFIALNPTANLQEIATAAGISKATFHRHFESRDALFIAIADYALVTLGSAFDQIPLTIEPEKRLRAIVTACTELGDKVYFLFYYPYHKTPPSFENRIQLALTPYYDTLNTLYESGYFNPKLPLSWLTNSLHTHISIAWVQIHIGNIVLKEAVDLLWTHFFEGAKRPTTLLKNHDDLH